MLFHTTVHKAMGDEGFTAGTDGSCGWSSAKECRSWVRARSLVLFLLLPFSWAVFAEKSLQCSTLVGRHYWSLIILTSQSTLLLYFLLTPVYRATVLLTSWDHSVKALHSIENLWTFNPSGTAHHLPHPQANGEPHVFATLLGGGLCRMSKAMLMMLYYELLHTLLSWEPAGASMGCWCIPGHFSLVHLWILLPTQNTCPDLLVLGAVLKCMLPRQWKIYHITETATAQMNTDTVQMSSRTYWVASISGSIIVKCERFAVHGDLDQLSGLFSDLDLSALGQLCTLKLQDLNPRHLFINL